ncbi:MAG TPA: MFS transporter [Kofleriaceae bacterium]|jgi:PPP family 3-phenylpropionic acid transporter|nr:MFS transporter [Kofleriaceae bacterium]
MRSSTIIALFYAIYFGAIGLYTPYLAMYLQAIGLSPSTLARVMALGPAMMLLSPPLFGLVADARHSRVWVLRGCIGMTAVAFVGFLFGQGLMMLYLTIAVFSLFRAPIPSLVDSAALTAAEREGTTYGVIRLWGSLGFVVTVQAGGFVLGAAGVRTVLTLGAMFFGMAALLAWRLPAPPLVVRPQIVSSWLRLLAHRRMWIFVATAALTQTAGSAYDTCYALHLTALGHSGAFIGLAWGLGALGEMLLLWRSGVLFARFGPTLLLAGALGIAVVRWTLIATLHAPWALLLVQPLHAFTFGLFYVSSVMWVREHAGEELPTAAQGLFAAATGLGATLGTAGSGPLFARFGGQGVFLAAGAVAALGFAGTLLLLQGGREARRRSTATR